MTASASSAPAARRSLGLPGEPASAGRARQVLRELLTSAGRREWLDAAELAVTEVVGNAVLHAHTAIEFTAEIHETELRVEVRDHNPVLPVQRDLDEHATTGRGVALVAALTDAHGISDVGPGGKTVWFTLSGGKEERSDDDLLAGWGGDWDVDDETETADGPSSRTGEGGVDVQLRRLPPALWLAAQQHHDALLRELALYLAEHHGEEVDLPAADRARSVIAAAVAAAVRHAQQTGLARRLLPPGHPSPLEDLPDPFDLEVGIAPELSPAFAALQDALDTAERLARAGRLLARPGLPETIALRDWLCEQVTAQLAGVVPAPWPGTDQERFAVAGSDATASSGWDAAAVRDSDRRVVAADQANRILAVSRALARLAGWSAEDLVGRRVVTLIPRHLREAHVAGFTRHLTTGEAHVLGVPLTLPLLRADDTEIPCRFVVERSSSPAGHAVYLAWIDPVPDPAA